MMDLQRTTLMKTHGYIENLYALTQAHEKMAAESVKPGILERGANYLSEGFRDLGEGHLNVFNPESTIRKGFARNMEEALARQASRLNLGSEPLSFWQKIRPAVSSAWDAVSKGGHGKSLAALGTLGAGALGTGALAYGVGKSLFSKPSYPPPGYY